LAPTRRGPVGLIRQYFAMPNFQTATYHSRPIGLRALKRELFWHRLGRRRFRTLDEVRAYQIDHIRSLVRDAGIHVPFYRERFRALGLEADDIRTFDDYARIPVLTREDVLANLPDLWSRRYRQRDLLLMGTGGSTGVPMSYYKDVDDLDRSQVVLARSHTWMGKGRWDLLAFFGSKHEPPGLRGELQRLVRAVTERRLFFDTFAASPDDMREWVRTLWRYRPHYAYGYPSALQHFAAWVQTGGLDLPPFRGVIVSAEILYPHQRAMLEGTFRAPVFDFYGSREVPNIAVTCVRQRMHQVADWVFTEFVRDADLPAPRIVVTPLECCSMPLIRYANGDLGSPVEGDCPCGLPHPLMDVNVARVVDVFVTPEGTRIYGQFFTHLLYGVAGIKQFQFHQVATDRIRLLLVKDSAFDAATAQKLDDVKARIHQQASPLIHVELEYVNDIPRTAMGKHLFTRSDVWTLRSDARRVDVVDER
jgi:phenylacetate-CoA ligase